MIYPEVLRSPASQEQGENLSNSASNTCKYASVLRQILTPQLIFSRRQKKKGRPWPRDIINSSGEEVLMYTVVIYRSFPQFP